MQIKKVSLSDLFSQLIAGFRLVGNHPGRFVLASIYTLLASIALAALIIGGGFLFAKADGESAAAFLKALGEQQPGTLVYLYGYILIIYLVLAPIYAGWLLLCQQTDKSADASALTLFSPYARRSLWTKLASYIVVGLLIYAATIYLFELLMLAFGIDMQAIARSMDPNAGGNPKVVLNLGIGYWIALCFSIVLNFLLQCALYLGFVHCALACDGVFTTLKAGLFGVLKNLLPIIVFTVLVIIILFVIMFVGILAGVLLAWLNKALATVIGIVALLFLLLYGSAVSVAFLYYLWKGILGNDNAVETRIRDSEVSA